MGELETAEESTLVRVLYVGANQIGMDISDGITLANLYTGYPEAKLTQYVRTAGLNPSYGHVIEIPRMDSPLTYPIAVLVRGAQKFRQCRLRKRPLYEKNTATSGAASSNRFLASLVAAADLAPVWVPPKKARELRRRSPEVIHAVVGRVRTLRRVLAVSRKLNIPVVPHFLDDWITTAYSNGELRGFARRRTLALLEELIERSPLVFVIGDAMAQEYESRYNRPSIPLASSIDPAEFQHRYSPSLSSKRLVYVGSPIIGRAEIVDYVARFARKVGWEVVVFPLMRQKWLELSSEIIPEDQLDPIEIPRVLCEADALLFPESTDARISDFTRLSVSTKLSQFIAARRPILAIGPSDQASIKQIAVDAAVSIAIHELNEEALSIAFERLNANLHPISRPVPEKYLAGNTRIRMYDTLLKASKHGVPRVHTIRTLLGTISHRESESRRRQIGSYD